MKKSQIGIAGLAVMGENLVMNMASRGFEVAVYNRTSSKTKAFIEGRAQGHSIQGYYSLEEFVGVPARRVGRDGWRAPKRPHVLTRRFVHRVELRAPA